MVFSRGGGWAGAGLGVTTNFTLGLIVVAGFGIITAGGFLVYWYLGFGVVLASAQKQRVKVTKITTRVDR